VKRRASHPASSVWRCEQLRAHECGARAPWRCGRMPAEVRG
jgi:hypothetical protein